jgi:hypothetical protein
MPSSLPDHIDGLASTDWKEIILGVARNYAEECITLGREYSQPEAVTGCIVAARIEAASGAILMTTRRCIEPRQRDC